MLQVPLSAAPHIIGGYPMKQFYTQRDSFINTKYAKFLAFFWMYLLTIYLISLWT